MDQQPGAYWSTQPVSQATQQPVAQWTGYQMPQSSHNLDDNDEFGNFESAVNQPDEFSDFFGADEPKKKGSLLDWYKDRAVASPTGAKPPPSAATMWNPEISGLFSPDRPGQSTQINLSGEAGLSQLIAHLLAHDDYEHAIRCARHLEAVRKVPVLEIKRSVLQSEDKHRDAVAVTERIAALQETGPDIPNNDRIAWFNAAHVKGPGYLSRVQMDKHLMANNMGELGLATAVPVSDGLEDVIRAEKSYRAARRAFFFMWTLGYPSPSLCHQWTQLLTASVSEMKIFRENIDKYHGDGLDIHIRAIVEVLRVALRIRVRASLCNISEVVGMCNAVCGMWDEAYSLLLKRKKRPASFVSFVKQFCRPAAHYEAVILAQLDGVVMNDAVPLSAPMTWPSGARGCAACGHPEGPASVFNDAFVVWSGKPIHATCANLWICRASHSV